MSMIEDRIRKNLNRLKPWAHRLGFSSYRLYDWDIPEYPFYVDLYSDEFVVSFKGHEGSPRDEQHLQELLHFLPLLKEDLGLQAAPTIHLKRRMTQTRTEKYEKTDSQGHRKIVREGPLRLGVNLTDYLDTGLFLDHRPLRERLIKQGQGKTLLNLFCYTGSISVAGAYGGATVTSVDLSQTYLDWAKDNFVLNDLDPQRHQFWREDILQYLARTPEGKYDWIVLDPPIFSNSKKMLDVLDTQRDHVGLIKSCLARLSAGGILFFSTNKQGFRLDREALSDFSVRDITATSVPKDFHRQKPHVCFEITHKQS